jgi:hypothetical protein
MQFFFQGVGRASCLLSEVCPLFASLYFQKWPVFFTYSHPLGNRANALFTAYPGGLRATAWIAELGPQLAGPTEGGADNSLHIDHSTSAVAN